MSASPGIAFDWLGGLRSSSPACPALAEIIDPRSGEGPFRNASDDAVLRQIVAIFAEAVAGVENAAKNALSSGTR